MAVYLVLHIVENLWDKCTERGESWPKFWVEFECGVTDANEYKLPVCKCVV